MDVKIISLDQVAVVDVEVQLKELLLEKDKVAMVDLSQLTLVDVDMDAQLKES